MPSIVRYNPWSLLRDIQGEVNQMLDRNLTGSNLSEVETTQWSPHVDIKEEADKFVISADLPGVEPKDIEISMENNVLTIRGKRLLERKTKEQHYSRIERISGTFYRRFSLLDNVNSEAIQAATKQGVLEITLPKKERNVPKKIEVQAIEK